MTITPGIDGGWAWLVLAASFVVHVLSYGMAWSSGVYNVIFLDAFKEPKALTALAGALPTAVMYAIGPISSMLSNKFGFRKVVFAGGLLAAAGLSLSYFVTNLYYLYVTFGVMSGAGFGIAYIPAITAVSCYFDTKLNIAAGIAASGVGVGNFLYPPLIRWLINMYDWKQSLLILGALQLHICLCAMVMRPVKRQDIDKNQPILDITPFKKKGYIMLCINNFLFCCGISALYIHLTALAELKGINSDLSAMLISGLGIANICGSLGFGILANCNLFDAVVLYGVSFFLSGLCICLLPFVDTFASMLIISVIVGLLSGCLGTLLVTILIQLLGLQRFANGYGCLLLFAAGGQLTGGFLAGAMFDLTESYTLAFVIGGLLAIVSSFVMIQPYCYIRNHPLTLQEIEVSAEKAALADSTTSFATSNYPSNQDIIQMAVSMESLVVIKRILDVQKSTRSLNVLNLPKSNNSNKSSMDSLVVNKKLAALKTGNTLSASIETV